MPFRAKCADSRHKNQDADAAKSMCVDVSLLQFLPGILSERVMEERMYGVVLWADDRDSKAVIWCEDHGNLAYYSAAEQNLHQGVALDPGDLIQFDLREDPDYRRARNLQRVDVGYAPEIAQNLRNTNRECQGNVVPFPGR